PSAYRTSAERSTLNAVSASRTTVLEALLRDGLTGRHATRLKACAAPECRWVFYDRAPSSNGLWCDMDVCGARHKMRAYRARTGAAARKDT
ncbi:CGNR zinc finger domain-containing protein, partial [Streptomyces cyaneofuscatus]